MHLFIYLFHRPTHSVNSPTHIVNPPTHIVNSPTHIANSLPVANTATATTAMTNTSLMALCMTPCNDWTMVTDQEPCAEWGIHPTFIHGQVMA